MQPCSVEYGVRVLDSIYDGTTKVEPDKVGHLSPAVLVAWPVQPLMILRGE